MENLSNFQYLTYGEKNFILYKIEEINQRFVSLKEEMIRTGLIVDMYVFQSWLPEDERIPIDCDVNYLQMNVSFFGGV